MKALTICQPYAHLICLPDDDDRNKRVENRTWPTNYRGPMLIHAGKSRQWLAGNNYGIPLDNMAFGAIVGIADLRDCVKLIEFESGIKRVPEHARRRWPWLAMHEHTEGPFCFVLCEVRRFARPIPYRGAQGFFDVPREVVAAAIGGTPESEAAK